MRQIRLLIGVIAAFAANAVFAHGDAPHAAAPRSASDADATPFGHPGNAANVNRTVNLTMSDAMRFSPSSVNVKKGETVRFVLRNKR